MTDHRTDHQTDHRTDPPTSTTSSTPGGVGVFARVFPAGPAPQVAAAVHAAGFDTTQLNLSALDRPTLDDTLGDEEAAAIGRAFTLAGVRLWGLSGTFNAIHPDRARRRRDTEACAALIARAPAMGVPVVTLCTGTRDPDNQWRAHPDNTLPDAWSELRATLEVLLAAADAAGVQLGIEPESGNVVRDTDAAVRLLAELGDDARLLTIVLDPANLLSVATLPEQQRILDDAFDRLGDHLGALHAKDVVDEGSAAIGHGGLDLDLVLRRHAGLPRPVPVIAQDLTADDAPRVSRLLRDGLARAHDDAAGTSPRTGRS